MSCLGKRKQKKKLMYSSHHSGEFEAYDIVLYEPVVLQENFQYGTLVLIGRSREGGRGWERECVGVDVDTVVSTNVHVHLCKMLQ